MGLVWSLERTEHPMTETESATLRVHERARIS
jgi:hypothetical protein